MKISVFLILLTFISLQMAQAQDNKMNKRVAHAIEKLSKRGYLFFAHRKYGPVEKWILLGGEEIFKTNRKEYLVSDYPEQAAKIIPQNIVKQISQFKNKNYNILLKNKLKFYRLVDNKLKRLPPSYFYNYDIKNIKEVKKNINQTLKHSHCSYCQFKFSANYVSFNGHFQFSPEIAWLYYHEINKRFGISIPTGLSYYLTENNNLEQQFSIGFKTQILGRLFVTDQFFVEAGGGLHYFFNYSETSAVTSVGIGNIFEHNYWIISRAIAFSGLFLQYSKVSWRQNLQEYKLGIRFSF